MAGVLVELGRVRTLKTGNVSGEFDHGTLHPEADAEKWNLLFTRPADRFNLAFGATFAKTARNQQTIVTAQNSLGTVAFNQFALDAADANLSMILDASVIRSIS